MNQCASPSRVRLPSCVGFYHQHTQNPQTLQSTGFRLRIRLRLPHGSTEAGAAERQQRQLAQRALLRPGGRGRQGYRSQPRWTRRKWQCPRSGRACWRRPHGCSRPLGRKLLAGCRHYCSLGDWSRRQPVACSLSWSVSARMCSRRLKGGCSNVPVRFWPIGHTLCLLGISALLTR